MKMNLDNFCRLNYGNNFKNYIFYDEKRIIKYENKLPYSCPYWYYKILNWGVNESNIYFHVIPNNKQRIQQEHHFEYSYFHTLVFRELVDTKLCVGLNIIRSRIFSKHKFTFITPENIDSII